MEQLQITIYSRRAKRKELLLACKMITNQTKCEDGCIDCRLFTPGGKERIIELGQVWQKRVQLDTYFRSDSFSALLGAMKLLADDYTVSINNGSHAEGIEAISHVRRNR